MTKPETKTISESSMISFYSQDTAIVLSDKVKITCAQKISQALQDHPYTMLQYSSFQILEAINQSRAVIALDENQNLAGFAQFWLYGSNPDGQPIYEFGSWLSFSPGCGKKVLESAVILGKTKFPQAQLIAIVEQENLKAQAILINFGAKEIGQKFSPYIVTVEGQPATMKIFDITQIN